MKTSQKARIQWGGKDKAQNDKSQVELDNTSLIDMATFEQQANESLQKVLNFLKKTKESQADLKEHLYKVKEKFQ